MLLECSGVKLLNNVNKPFLGVHKITFLELHIAKFSECSSNFDNVVIT